MEFVLWERVALRELIQRKYLASLALRTVTDYLKRLEMATQKPVKGFYEQNAYAAEY
tara:strand:- start:175 stop:345 length:171 start_codon:yes stop_codon:yes gene_type:complete